MNLGNYRSTAASAYYIIGTITDNTTKLQYFIIRDYTHNNMQLMRITEQDKTDVIDVDEIFEYSESSCEFY